MYIILIEHENEDTRKKFWRIAPADARLNFDTIIADADRLAARELKRTAVVELKSIREPHITVAPCTLFSLKDFS